MTLFFLVVELEIRIEMHRGVLRDSKRAALPFAAALGGMIAPALIYASMTSSGAYAGGWRIPIATDIAFAAGVLTLLGSRVPPALRVLLLALAVIDEVGAVLVMGGSSSDGLVALGAATGLVGVGAILALQRFDVDRWWAYVPAGGLVWWGCASAGIHPALAGVAVGMLTPAVGRADGPGPLDRVRESLRPWATRASRPRFAPTSRTSRTSAGSRPSSPSPTRAVMDEVRALRGRARLRWRRPVAYRARSECAPHSCSLTGQ